MSTSKPILRSLPVPVARDLLARFELSVDRSGGPEACWPWTGPTVAGYGVAWTCGSAAHRRMVKAHRLAFEAAGGDDECPTVDHACHDHETCAGGVQCPHRRCCNPAHLVAATREYNARRAQEGKRQDRCAAGHDMRDEANVYYTPQGGRQCRRCAADRAQERRREAAAGRAGRAPRRRYRPRGMTPEQVAEWMLSIAERTGDGCLVPDVSHDGGGYRQIVIGGRNVYAHRLVYEVKKGPIPDGMMVDHTCHDPATCAGGLTCPHRACVNPDHLELTTNAENVSQARASRKQVTHCAHGHEFTPENTYTDKRGSRHCRRCAADRAAAVARKASDGRRRANGKCVNGHDVTVAGLTPSGPCRECARERNREYEARRRA